MLEMDFGATLDYVTLTGYLLSLVWFMFTSPFSPDETNATRILSSGEQLGWSPQTQPVVKS